MNDTMQIHIHTGSTFAFLCAKTTVSLSRSEMSYAILDLLVLWPPS